MMERSIVNIDYDGWGTQGKNRILCGYRLDEDEITLASDLYLVDVFKPLLREQDSLVSHFGAHVGLSVKGLKERLEDQ